MIIQNKLKLSRMPIQLSSWVEQEENQAQNAKIFKQHGKNLNKSAKKTCKCLVVANPANTNCMILADNAPEIPSENFTALTRLDYNRFVSQTANLFNCKVSQIKNAIVWGNHSRKQFCDLTQVQIQGFTKQAISNKVKQLDYNQVQVRMYDRGGFMLQKKSGNIFLSATKAIIDHLSDWYRGSNKIVSMGVIVKNNVYGIKQSLCFSLPVMCSGLGQLNIVSNLELNQYQRKRIQQSQQELTKERNIVIAYLRQKEEPAQ